MSAKIAVIGGGYVGLVTAACFSSLGNEVICAEMDEGRAAALRQGRIPIYEPGLEQLVKDGVAAGHLSFTTSALDAAKRSEFIFICVQTPPDDDGSADMTFVDGAAAEISPALSPRSIVINKSTMPVGSTERVKRVAEQAGAADVHFVSNPEFLREGTAVYDFMHPDRVVIGSSDTEAAVRVSELYRGLNAPILIMDPASAEMVKYASNAFLAAKISFANAVANLCEATGADVAEVTLGMGYDRRIGFEFLKPGPGFGGSCFPKDCKALRAAARSAGVGFPILDATLEINDQQIHLVLDKVRGLVGGLEGRRIGVLGLSFKANTDDVRDSPAVEICKHLLAEGAEVVATDPQGAEKAQALVPELKVVSGAAEAAEGADCLVVATEWEEFRWLDYAEIGPAMANRAIVDARNLLDPSALRRAGFTYTGIGRL